MDEFSGSGLMPRVDVLTDPHCTSGALAEQHVDEAIVIGAQDAGLNVVMDACPKNRIDRITARRRRHGSAN
jgi:hypothetical protein